MPAAPRRKLSPLLLRLVLVGCALGITALFANWQFKRTWAYGLLGVRTYLGSPTAEFNLDAGLNGDGYNLSQYRLPPDIVQEFRKVLELTPDAFPEVPDYRREWKCDKWRPTPAGTDEQQSAEFALDGPPADVRGSVLSRLSEPGSWYAQCVKRDDGKNISNSELFLIDPVQGVLTTAIVNT